MVHIEADIDIAATPKEILDVLADLTHYPEWSAVHKSARIQACFDDGKPQRATMGVSAAGLTDNQTIDYVWSTKGLEWSLVRSLSQRDQHGRYVITKAGRGASHVHYELDIDPAIPVPGFLARQVMRKAGVAATEGLKRRVDSLHADA